MLLYNGFTYLHTPYISPHTNYHHNIADFIDNTTTKQFKSNSSFEIQN